MTRAASRPARLAFAGVALATLLGAWLRLHGLAGQLVQDDEWHAIHKLATASYGEIFRSFGYADHSIPLTLFYKLLAAAAGLDEINLRAVQVACGIALVPLAGFLAWRVSQRASIAALVSALVALSPLLVLYSRTARPYAITTLLAVVACALVWRWREERSLRVAASIVLASALTAWLHPLASLYPAVALLFAFGEDLLRRPFERRLAARGLALGIAAALAVFALLAMPLVHDLDALTAKAASDYPGAYTLSRVLSHFAGGLPDPATVVAVALAAFGAWRVRRSHGTALALFLAVLFVVPMAVVAAAGATWTHQGHTFARYALPSLVIFLFWLAHGAVALADPRATRPALAAAAGGLVVALQLAAGPAVRQVASLGPWYGHLYHHFDYVPMHNEAARQYVAFDPPAFYRRLARLPAGSVTVIEAPFTYGAPANPMAFFDLYHAQRTIPGFVHDLCLAGPRSGEVPRDPRFRFRNFVFVDDVAAVRASGARYLVFYREQYHGRRPFREADRCVAELTRRYGEPIESDPRVVVYDLMRLR